MVSHLAFKPSSHFEFIFVHGVRMCSNFTDLYAAIQFSQYSLLMRLLPIIYSYLICRRLIDSGRVGLFLDSVLFQ